MSYCIACLCDTCNILTTHVLIVGTVAMPIVMQNDGQKTEALSGT